MLSIPPPPEESTLGAALVGRRVKVARAYEQLAEVLRESINEGAMREGDRLPSETRLAALAGVSRSTVREALRMLQEGGPDRAGQPQSDGGPRAE